MKILKTKRYVVGAGIRADLCEKCILATVDHAAMDRAEAFPMGTLGADENGEPAGYDLLNHANYIKIHPHPSQILKNICDPSVAYDKICNEENV